MNDFPACNCKDFVAAALVAFHQPRQGVNPYALDAPMEVLDSVYHLALSDCTCGSGRKRCHSSTHLNVLESFAGVYHKKGEYAKALQYSTMAINMAPGEPQVRVFRPCPSSPNKPSAKLVLTCRVQQGYICCIRAVLELDLHLADDRLSMTDLARCFGKHGLANVGNFGDVMDRKSQVCLLRLIITPRLDVLPLSKTQILSIYYCKLARYDFFSRLPIELLYMIFQNLPLRHLM